VRDLSPDEHRAFKDELYEAFAGAGKALSSSKRLEMLDLLAQKERSVQELADAMDVSVANASQHLQTLVDAHLVAKRSEGTYRYYKLADDGVFDLWRALRDLARDQLPEIDAIVERYLGPREAAPTPSPDSLAALDDEDMILLDVRPEDEYREGHLPGSRSVPIDEIEDRADELPEDEEYLVYCRGPFCVYSDQAVDILNDTGRQARRLEPGLPDWKAMGLTVATDFEEVDA